MGKSLALFVACTLISGIYGARADELATRFGKLTTNDDNVLLFRGRPVAPAVQGNNSLTLVKNYEIGPSDVALVQDNGGTSCPAQYYFISSNQSGAVSIGPFGTCSDIMKVDRSGDGVTLAMAGLRGPSEPSSAQAKAAKEKHVFTFANGRVIENGKIVR